MPRRPSGRVGNLPVELTGFVGRSAELLQAQTTLAEARHVTLVGAGGVGKSRLARRLGAELGRGFPGGVWLVDLAGAPRGADVAAAVADAAPAAIRDERATLLVLDNAEHLLDECARFVAAVVRDRAASRVVVTSRQPLGVLGEHVLEIGPLGLPASTQDLTTADAVRLFADRAGAADPAFTLTHGTAPTVAAICRRLDGVPLAIELAALRLRVLSVAELLARLDDPAELHRLSSRAARPRRRSLYAAHEWSHDLCSTNERRLWARLSVFAGRFDLDAAIAVCAGGGLADDEVPGLLACLVEKSIVTREAAGTDFRYRLMTTVRQFGDLRLRENGDADRCRERHVDYVARRGPRLLDELRACGVAATYPTIEREHHDLTATIDVLRARRDRLTDALCLATVLCRCPVEPHSAAAARRRLDEVLAIATAPTSARVHALLTHGLGALAAGEEDTATAALRAGTRLADQLGDRSVAGYVTEAAGLRAAAAGQLDSAGDLLVRAFRAHVAGADEFGLHQSYRHLLVVAWAHGGPDWLTRVGRLATETTVALRPAWAPYAGVTAGLTSLRGGSAGAAVRSLTDALGGLRSSGDHRWIALCCDALAQCAWLRGDPDDAARLLGYASMVWDSLEVSDTFVGGRLDPRGKHDRHLRSQLGPDAFAAAAAEGAALTLDEVAALARGARRPAEPAPPAVILTPREIDVAELVCQGLTNRAIGAALSVSKRTVETHIEHLMTRLGCTTRTQIAARFIATHPGAGRS
jgi:predicted ATPase/DNA-binding CsgD family transcriptional regulator